MNHKLEFLNPALNQGINVTVRLGDKWKNKANIDDTIDIYRTGSNEILAKGIINSIEYKPFPFITISDLWSEHDPECRTPEGLVRAMIRDYPEFNLGSMVTVIRFVI